MISTSFRRLAGLALAIVLAHHNPALAQADAILGIYHNQFSGGFAGSEWFQVTPLEGQPGRYTFADIYGGGFTGTVTGDAIVIDDDRGTGRVTGPGTFVLMPVLGGTPFTFDSVRVPQTTSAFPLSPITARRGDARYAGTWISRTHSVDPRTGADLGVGQETLMVSVAGTTLRMTDPAGLYFQGVFSADDVVAFRVTEGTPVRSPRFATLAGSAVNFDQDMLGALVFQDADHFTATVLLRSRDPLGAQKQRLVTFEAERAPGSD